MKIRSIFPHCSEAILPQVKNLKAFDKFSHCLTVNNVFLSLKLIVLLLLGKNVER